MYHATRQAIACILIAPLLTAGCAHKATGENYRPIVDLKDADPIRFEADLSECQAYARQLAGAAEQAVAGAVAGALFGALLAAAAGGGYNRDQHATVGAVMGMATGAVEGEKDQRSIITRCLGSLRGFEGAAARAYFAGLAGVMPPALEFGGRNRRPPRDPVNVCLSLGYTLLHTQAVQACTMAGLDPLLGFYHRPSFGRESLASDLIEPLRPAMDLWWVWELLRTRNLREEHFSTDKGACLLGKAGRGVFYADWQTNSKPWQRWLQGHAQRLANSLRTTGTAWLATAADEDETC